MSKIKTAPSLESKALNEIKAYRNLLHQAPPIKRRRRRKPWALVASLVAVLMVGLVGGVVVERTVDFSDRPAQPASLAASAPQPAPEPAPNPVATGPEVFAPLTAVGDGYGFSFDPTDPVVMAYKPSPFVSPRAPVDEQWDDLDATIGRSWAPALRAAIAPVVPRPTPPEPQVVKVAPAPAPSPPTAAGPSQETPQVAEAVPAPQTVALPDPMPTPPAAAGPRQETPQVAEAEPLPNAPLPQPQVTQPQVTQPAPAPETKVAKAVPAPAATSGRPMIAIVLDDLGLNRPAARRAIALPGPLNLAFMTYAERLPGLAATARAAGHELLVHVPMEPESRAEDPGLNALLIEHDPAVLRARLTWGLGRFEGYVGINNHMGSRFTSQTEGMRAVFAELKARGLMFLDSKTTAASVARDLAEEYQVAYVARDVFIDNSYQSRQSIRRQLAQLEKIARRRGSAVGLGHPHRTTLDELARWIPEARARGFELVPVSAIARHRQTKTADGKPFS